MNYQAIAIATIVGMSAPGIAVADAKYDYPTGSFSNSTWVVTLTNDNNTYRYQGKYLPKGTGIELVGASPSGTHERQVYTWNNNGLKYQVAWRPKDPGTIRVQVRKRSGEITLDVLLKEPQ